MTEPTKKTWFASHHILGYIFLALVLGGVIAAIYFWRNPAQVLSPELPVTQNHTATNQPANTPIPSINTLAPVNSGWKTYTDTKDGFSFQYPSYVKAGAVAKNSTLGTYSVPVPGIFAGSYVIVPLTTPQEIADANSTVDGMIESANNPTPAGDGPVVVCSVDKFTNPQATIKAGSCQGEGGPAFYAVIHSTTRDIFVDGYSKGFADPSSLVDIKDADIAQFFSSFNFSH